jgi:SAM-dependent methyltransferase
MVGAYNAKAKAQVSPQDFRGRKRSLFFYRILLVVSLLSSLLVNTSQGATREAFQGNFADPKAAALSDAKFFNFDAAGVGLGWHHLDEGELVAKKLVERLKPGGVFFILDFVPSSLSVEAAAGRGVKHDGFSEEQMRDLFEGAGAGKDFSYELIPETISFPGIHGANDGHDHGHGHGHNHGHGHGHSHEHAREQGQLGDRTLKIFIARGSKL